MPGERLEDKESREMLDGWMISWGDKRRGDIFLIVSGKRKKKEDDEERSSQSRSEIKGRGGEMN